MKWLNMKKKQFIVVKTFLKKGLENDLATFGSLTIP
jgi:hypothetical protein